MLGWDGASGSFEQFFEEHVQDYHGVIFEANSALRVILDPVERQLTSTASGTLSLVCPLESASHHFIAHCGD
ncbi:Phosphatase 2C beta [Echinococcus multilocularis]|uniref:Phosphatase 2C beta n=1 Tax=Echinococcus multilocularis TaxID=6211 RepID=A0A068XXC5_ECHMU|nr:Phosphatase 2C beta [Echinococcus multilocularis]